MSIYLEDDAVQHLLELLETGRAHTARTMLLGWEAEQNKAHQAHPYAVAAGQRVVAAGGTVEVSVDEDAVVIPATPEPGCWLSAWLRLTEDECKVSGS